MNEEALYEIIARQELRIERLEDQMKLIYQIVGAHIGCEMDEETE